MFSLFNQKQDVRSLINLLEGQTQDTSKFVQRDYAIKPTEPFKYIRIDLSMFFSRCNMNVRPKKLEFTITNLTPKSCKDTVFYYIHTPLVETDLSKYNPADFTHFWKFTDTFTITVNAPYLTCFLTDTNGICKDIDFSQLTNINLTYFRVPDVSFGGIYILPNRIDTNILAYQIQYRLYYVENKY